jgi:hypothetical protein
MSRAAGAVPQRSTLGQCLKNAGECRNRSVAMKKYHVALSFAGEDREYVDQVAKCLQAKGVQVFYDKFEDTKLWGKDLYTYLSDVYQNQAFFTVMFISEAYKEKL